jgi:hypothetical protein
MKFVAISSCALTVALMSATAAAAQDTPPRPGDHAQLRHQIYVMEGALSRAVEFGAQSLNREIRAFMPEGFVLAGQARARGVYLDGYGVFFDVEVPILRQSMIWSLKTMLDQDSAGLQKALADLRQIAKSTPDTAARQAAERAISRIELQLAPMGVQGAPLNPFAAAIQNAQQQSQQVPAQSGLATSVAQTTGVQGAPPMVDVPQEPTRDLPIDKPWMRDPNRAYTEAVQRAIVDAMIDYSAPMTVGPDEYLTVAARDNYQRDSLAPPDPFEEVETILLRIKGSDLSEYRAGKIDRDEARKRVILTSF